MRQPVQPTALPQTQGVWRGRQARVLAGLAGFWLVSDLAYYYGLPALGIDPGYSESPMQVAVFYVFWAGLAAIVFWPLYSRWNADAPWPTLRNRVLAAAVWVAVFAGMMAFLLYGMPALPTAFWPEGSNPPDLLVATPAYFLPKTIEILFQQLLVMALVVSLSIDGFSLRMISYACAALFGGMHVLLAFSGIPPYALLLFMTASTLFGFVLPRLVLTTRFGLAVSFSLHWGFYVLAMSQARIFGPNLAQRVLG